MVNITGRNGYHNGTQPSDEELKEALMGYAREGLTLAKRRERLVAEFNYIIGDTKLKRVQRQFNIPTTRKPPPLAVATTLVCAKMAEDLNRLNGPSTIKQFIAMDGFAIPRDTVRAIMHANDPGGAAIRFPGGRAKVKRSQLRSFGVFHEVSCDGHEKFASFALGLGDVSLPIYGMREKWAGALLSLRVVPNARNAVIIGHIYLDFVAKFGAIPLQITVDKGSETGDMTALHAELRKRYTPDLDVNQWPPSVALKSVHNITIENLWSRFRKVRGHNIQDILIQGRSNGAFNPNSVVHRDLFHWIWPPIVQNELDEFVEYWNAHTVRTQPNKNMPSGGTPNDFFVRPEAYNGQRLSVPVEPQVIDELRDRLSVNREEAFRWVDDEFGALAEEVYSGIGSPSLSVHNGWLVFAQMCPQLEALYHV